MAQWDPTPSATSKEVPDDAITRNLVYNGLPAIHLTGWGFGPPGQLNPRSSVLLKDRTAHGGSQL